VSRSQGREPAPPGGHRARLTDRGRVGLVGFLVIALMVALLPPPASAQVAGFTDVRPTNVHAEAIAELAAAGILLGYGDGTFRPAASITRGQLASVIARAGELAPVLPAPFSDTAGNPHEGPIGALAAANILLGYEDGTFRPYAPITREHVAVVIARWLDVDPVADGPFTDVNRYAGQINALWEIGVSSDNEVTVPLHWQNQYRASDRTVRPAWTTTPPTTSTPTAAGEVTFRWDDGATTVVVEG
jgi:hypothetical protein